MSQRQLKLAKMIIKKICTLSLKVIIGGSGTFELRHFPTMYQTILKIQAKYMKTVENDKASGLSIERQSV